MTGAAVETWRDPGAPAAARVADLMGRMELREKVAQLAGIWVNAGEPGGEEVAPHQHEHAAAAEDWGALIRDGIGQLTRPFGTAPVDPVEGARRLAARQRWLTDYTRLGLPALVHEECLTGLAAWKATTFPAPLSWGASFHPELVEEMGAAIGASMRSLGVHQGLAPVLDVVRDTRWGRVEECISEDPTSSGRSPARTCAACSPPEWSPRSSTSSGTRTRARAATSPRCTPDRARWPTCSCRRSRWRSATAAPAPS